MIADESRAVWLTATSAGITALILAKLTGGSVAMWADQAFYKLLKEYDFKTVLDIGCGTGEHAKLFREAGKDVTTISLSAPADVIGDFNYPPPTIIADTPYDCIWASHVLEHQTNVGIFLERCRYLMDDGGILAITVPPLKHDIVGGHVSRWNAGTLLYNLVLAGFDCSNAAVRTYGYNISVILEKVPIPAEVFTRLSMDSGDIEQLAPYFPLEVREGFDGRIGTVNW